MSINIWTILAIATPILLIIYWKSKNAVWGGFTIGIIVGLILAIISKIKGDNFNWFTIIKWLEIGTIAGFFAEMLSKLGNLSKKS